MEKRQRKRVPVSCLNCKKRKVRCDKQKPCTGCVKNNVGDLCVYVEPEWVDTTVKIAAGAFQTPIEELDEYRRLKAQLEATIASQSTQIETLRRQVADTSTNNRNAAANSGTVSILQKLASATDVPALEILDDHFYSMKGFRVKAADAGESVAVGLYSWLNVIRLDPQLTALWFRITSLQKLYHVYKTSLVGRMRNNSPACGHHKCPVVACEFNLMDEGTPKGDGTDGESFEDVSERAVDDKDVSSKSYTYADRSTGPDGGSDHPMIKKEDSVESYESGGSNQMANDYAVDLLELLQRLWEEIANCGRGEYRLTYAQLMFLLDFYFRSTTPASYEVESKHILRFYYPEIVALLVQEGESVRVDLMAFSFSKSEPEAYSQLMLKGIYLLMLALIVEEALDMLRLRVGELPEFLRLFSNEALHVGLGYKRTNVPGLVRSILLRLSPEYPGAPPLSFTAANTSSLSCIAVLVALTNRYVVLYKKPGLTVDIKDSFTTMFTLLLDILDGNGERIQLWADPAQVSLINGSSARQNELRLHLCYLWCDFMRLANQVTFSTVPIVHHADRLDKRLAEYFAAIADAENAHAHVSYVTNKRADVDSAELLASLHVYYLISRSFVLLRRGVSRTSTKVTVGDLQKVIAEMSAWAGEITLTKLRMARYFEVRIILHYLEFYLTYIIFLQSEDIGDDKMVLQHLPYLVAKCLDLNKFLQGSVVQFSKSVGSQYILAAVAETLSRVSHLIVGLLIRFKADLDTPSPPNTPAPSLLVYALKASPVLAISVSDKDEVIRETDRTLQLLENVVNKETFKRVSKTWRFYMTFVRNSHRMNPTAYAKLHAEVFGSGRLLDACPVMPHSTKYPTLSARGEQTCPVLHSAATISTGARVSPKMVLTPSADKKRKCPFDHEALRNGTMGFHESNIRGLNPKIELPTPVLPMQIQQPRALAAHTVINQLVSETLDWDTLPNFDFEFMSDETLMIQMNGGDFNNPTIEGMFQ